MNCNQLIEATRAVLAGWGAREEQVGEGGGYWKILFPADNESEYVFVAYLYLDGDVQIAAVRNAAKLGEYFWYLSFEIHDYDSLEQMHDIFLDKLTKLISHDTRIIHHGGLLFRGFECEYRDQSGWHQVGGAGYFRWGGFKAPSQQNGTVWYAKSLK